MSKALNYREGKIDNLEKYPVPRGKFFYLSCHTLEPKSSYGSARLFRELTDKWLNCEISFAGLKFDPNVPEPTAEEVAAIPGAEAVVSSADRLKLEVLVRRGSSFIINPDEEKKWSSLSSTSDEFAALKAAHNSRTKDSLAGVIRVAADTPAAAPIALPTQTPDVEDEEEAEGEDKYLTYGSLEECSNANKIVHTVQSDIAGVKVLRSETGKIILFSETDRQLVKGMQLGGFGTGSYVPLTSDAQGLELVFPLGDKTKVQLEESSVKKDSTLNPTMTLYQLLVLIERQFKVTSHKLSYAEVERCVDASGKDAFKVKITKPMMYKFLEDDGTRDESGEAKAKKAKKELTGKAVFRFKKEALNGSSTLSSVFRYRYEKVGQTLKLMKPYVILAKNIKLEAKKPLEASGGGQQQKYFGNSRDGMVSAHDNQVLFYFYVCLENMFKIVWLNSIGGMQC